MRTRVWRGETDAVDIGPAQAVSVTIPRGAYEELQAVAHVDEPVVAPLGAGQQLGAISVSLDGEAITEVPLSALEAVGEGSFFSRLVDDVMLMFE